MNKKRNKLFCFLQIWKHVVICSIFILCSLSTHEAIKPNPILYRSVPLFFKGSHNPHKSKSDMNYFNSEYNSNSYPLNHYKEHLVENDMLQIEPSDAIKDVKYSQPEIHLKVPFKNNLKSESPSYNPLHGSVIIKGSPKDTLKSLRDMRYIDSTVDSFDSHEVKLKDLHSDIVLNDQPSLNAFQDNFTDVLNNLVPEASNPILSYENLSNVDLEKKVSLEKQSVLKSNKRTEDFPSQYSNPFPSDLNLTLLLPIVPTKSILTVLNSKKKLDILNATDEIENVISTALSPVYDNVTSTYSSSIDENNEIVSSGAVAVIVIAVLVGITVLSSAVIYLLYKKYNERCSSIESKFNSDNCGYLDDSLHSSIYLNNHILELPKESSEEMSSLDNDSFLNSLETMTIQNYWADSSKNTKL